MYTGMLHTHTLVVSLFLLIYLIKTGLLVMGKTEKLIAFTKKIKIPEMVVSALFFITGIYLAVNTGNAATWLWVKLAAVLIAIPLAVIGFKKLNRNLALLSLMLLIYAYGVSETKSAFFKKEEVASIASVNGKEIFETQCISCHGTDGKLKLSGAKDLSLSQITMDERIAIINSGIRTMPAYNSVLSADQIAAVATYTETLKN